MAVSQVREKIGALLLNLIELNKLRNFAFLNLEKIISA